MVALTLSSPGQKLCKFNVSYFLKYYIYIQRAKYYSGYQLLPSLSDIAGSKFKRFSILLFLLNPFMVMFINGMKRRRKKGKTLPFTQFSQLKGSSDTESCF